MKDRIYIATFSDGAIEAAAKYGFGLEINHTCVSDNMNEECRQDTVEWIKRDLKAAKAENGKYLIHGPFTELSPSSIDSRAVQLTWDRLMDSVEFCKIFNSKKLVVHTGFFPFLYYPVWHKEKSIEFWSKFSDAVPKDLTVCIENVFEEDPIIFREIIDEVGKENIRVCLDVGHVNAMASTDWPAERWIEYLGERISHFHLHNNVGGKKDLHGHVYEGSMDMNKILDSIMTYCGDDVTLTIESQKAMESAKWLSEWADGQR